MIIAIVPAKQFSRRLPNKNIKKFSGKPIILWTISILKKTKLFKKNLCINRL
jgi:pseudaminic acid cytidylyltransferase